LPVSGAFFTLLNPDQNVQKLRVPGFKKMTILSKNACHLGAVPGLLNDNRHDNMTT
jgi:hypothetical protein